MGGCPKNGRCPGGDGLGGVSASVGLTSWNRKEDKSRTHLSAVRSDAGHLAGADRGVLDIVREEIAERYQCAVPPVAGSLAGV